MSPDIGGDQGAEDASDNHVFLVEVDPRGGVGPYAYQWYIPSTSGSGIVEFDTGSTGAGVQVGMIPDTPGSPLSCSLYCAVTDATSRTVNSNTISLTYISP
jgi:hypothetical protein